MRRKKRNSQRLTCCLTWIAAGCSWSFLMDSALLVIVQLLHQCLIYCILLMFFILGSSSSKLLSYLLSDFYTDTAAADYHLPKSWQAPLTPVPVANMELEQIVAVPGRLTFLSQCVQTATSSWSHTFSCLLTTAWKPPITAAGVNSIFVMLTAFVFTPTDVSPCTHNKRREPVF